MALQNSGEYLKALKTAGALLAANASDLTAWYLLSKCMAGLGHKDDALKNLKNVSLAMARAGQPVSAITAAKEFIALGGEPESISKKIAALYAQGSSRLAELDIKPPVLPVNGCIPWSEDMGRSEAVEKAGEQMAVAWGDSMANRDNSSSLPVIPLFSALPEEDFVKLLDCFQLETVKSGNIIIKEDEVGDAMYVVALGMVTVERHSSSDISGSVRLATLGPGAFFGEMAIVSSSKRAASVKAVDDVILLKAEKAALDGLASGVPAIADVLVAFCHARMLENLMRISPVMAKVPSKFRADLIARFRTDFFNEGEQIIKEGDTASGLFLIVSGRVSILKEAGGSMTLLATLEPGDLFGEISLLLQKPSTASVVAAENTALLLLDREQFNEVTNDFPELLKGAFDIAIEREKMNNSILGQKAVSGEGLIII
jgi:cAMP-dependent protein kinase regulator